MPLQKDVKALAKSWCDAQKIDLKSFSGISYTDFPKFEDFFKIKLKIFELTQ